MFLMKNLAFHFYDFFEEKKLEKTEQSNPV